jgi:hypothetical protein
MRRVLVIVGLLAVGLVARLDATPPDCVTDKGCPSGAQPPVCCDKPPCEFQAALDFAYAARRMFSGKSAAAVQEAHGNGANARRIYEEIMSKDAPRLRRTECKSGQYREPPELELDNECIISVRDSSGNLQPTDFSQYYSMASQTCSELLDAAYARAMVNQTFCMAIDPKSRDWAASEHGEEAAWTQEIEVLENHLYRFWRACSSEPNVSPLMDNAKRALDQLLQKSAPAKARSPRKPASKSSKRS